MEAREDILDLLYAVVMERKGSGGEGSYTASLFRGGIDKILKKFGEEAVEVVIAGKGGTRAEIVYESADLLFHLLVLLGHHEIAPEEVYGELRRRFGVSGIAEKEARSTKAVESA